MKFKLNICFILTLFFSQYHWGNAREGKIFFSSSRWIKGDIQERINDKGESIVIIAIPSGSLILPRQSIQTIIYTGKTEPFQRKFNQALERTDVKTIYSKRRSSVLYEAYIREASEKHQIDPALVKAVIKQESNFNKGDVSRKGAQGLMQLMPETARQLGVADAFDPWQNIEAGTRFLKMMLEYFDGDLKKALAAYNAGTGAVEKYGTIPPYKETQNYVKNVLNYYKYYQNTKLFAFESPSGKLIFTDQPYVP